MMLAKKKILKRPPPTSIASTRAKRVRRKPIDPFYADPEPHFTNGYHLFRATQVIAIPKGQEQTTFVTLHLFNDEDVEVKVFTGESGKGNGHAEMDALIQYIDSEFVDSGDQLRLNCTAKPCCVRCSAILGLLNIEPFDHRTTKISRGMGMTNWNIRKELAEYVARKIDCHSSEIEAFTNKNKLD